MDYQSNILIFIQFVRTKFSFKVQQSVMLIPLCKIYESLLRKGE